MANYQPYLSGAGYTNRDTTTTNMAITGYPQRLEIPYARTTRGGFWTYLMNSEDWTENKTGEAIKFFLGSDWSSPYNWFGSNPSEGIISFGLIPTRPQTATSLPDFPIYCGTLTSSVRFWLVNPPAYYQTFTYGEISTFEPYYDNYLDYAPYTKMTLYLPYIGYKDVDPELFYTKSEYSLIRFRYAYDVITGALVVTMLGVEYPYTEFEQLHTLEQWIGNCMKRIPVTSVDTQAIQGGVMSMIVGAATGVVSAVSGNAAGVGAGLGMIGKGASEAFSQGATAPSMSSGDVGFLQDQRIFFTRKIPKQAFSTALPHLSGIESHITTYIPSTDTGTYMEIEKIHLDNIPALSDEIDELDSILKSGIIA